MADELENENLSNHLGDRTVARDINFRLSGELVGLGHNISKVKFVPVEDMCVDSRLIHSGFIFSAAAHCALTALNKKNSLIIGSDAKFLAPIELGHEVIFKGEALQDDTKKCEVKVEGFLLDIKVFYGMFYIAVFDKKIFKIKFDE
ncbi:PaaI family thioesterase [Helicobacter saguini]|uniref:PaaI family thioesterase n=1 Tax=Helicobacter saguini TaxID=1548018 RepID=A0A347VR15_9HELI|nr:thioesterase [Helicobacter saguini]MWV63075.1 PaaI family thioesterase [Helicobacter saguini]MWV66255.1 PaaI family thioesterase [Helicobacter saguini]MWV68608.1 PaaI family thioesterase [Helicobacter saguini]MWV71841.1 PaaI family thioesterase [Helicobacter saguini]TLD95862.1 PaaI family thioesterase [Helicobacter saguini]